MRERLQKILARAGVASRRAAEELITAGRVRVNGKVISELGAQAHPFEDKVEVDGRQVLAENLQYVVLHKPREVVSTLADPEGRPTVADFLKDAGGRVYPVGRLDFATSGVLLATNDGDFANGLLHPRKAVPKTYVVKVRGRMDDEDVDRWRKGVMLEDGKTLPAQVRRMRYEEERTWLEVTIHEGRNQQIRRMGDATGFFVMRLARISFAGITSDDLRPGQWRYLTRDELTAMRDAYGVPKRVKQVEAPLKPTDRSGNARGRVVQRGVEASPRRPRGGPATPAEAPHATGRGRGPGRTTTNDAEEPRHPAGRGRSGGRAASRAAAEPRATGGRHADRTAPRDVPRTEPRSAPRTEPRSAPRTEPRTAPRTEPRTAPRTEPRSTPRTESRSTPRTESRVDTRRREPAGSAPRSPRRPAGTTPPPRRPRKA